MKHRLPAVIGMVVVLLAGCAGFPLPADDTSNTPADNAPTTVHNVPDTGTATPTPTTTTQKTTTAEKIDYPPGYAASGIKNTERAVKQHFNALFSHDSFTYSVNRSLPGGRYATIVRTTLKDKRSNITHMYPNSSRRYYLVGNLSHVARYQPNGSVSYLVGELPFSISFMESMNQVTGRPPGDGIVTNVLRSAEFGDATPVTREGERLLRYESTQLRFKKQLLLFEGKNVTIDSATATILVGEDGIIRLATYSVTYTTSNGEQATQTATSRISRLDGTTVEKPEWVDEATAQANQTAATENSTTSTVSG